MALSEIQKENIFSFIKEPFSWCSKSKKLVISSFEDNLLPEKGFDITNGMVKYCVFHSYFEEYVIKFCLDDFDYCKREYENYCAATERGLEKFFPYTDFLGKINDVFFYIQERAEVDETYVNSIWYSQINETYEPWREEETEEEKNEIILSMVSDLDDECRIQLLYDDDELADFLEEYCINDLHEGNYGMIDGRLVIIDFSGFGPLAKNREF